MATKEKKVIDPIDVSFNREDMDALVAKVNEVIEAVNEG